MNVVAFDTETHGLDWFDGKHAFLATWADEHGDYCANLSDPAEVGQFLTALREADVIVAHNLSFDVHQVRETLDFDILDLGKELHDTDLMARVLYPAGAGADSNRFGLKHLATVYIDPEAGEAEKAIEEHASAIGVKLREDEGYYETWRAYPAVMERYARLDAVYTLKLWQMFSEALKQDENAARCYALEQQVAPILIRAEQRGVHVDQAAVLKLKKHYEKIERDLHEKLAVELGEEALGGRGSEEALVEALLKIGVPLWKKTDSGKFSIDKYTIQEFENDFPILADFSTWRSASKFLSTYIGPMVNRDTVHPSFSQCGAWTGRMSCRRPNMQNIPKAAGKEVRAMFTPREGHALVVCDYDSIEVRLLAYYLGDKGFRQLIEDGHDPHAWMATHIHEDGDTSKMPEYVKGSPGQPKRDKAKNTLFAITYGAGGQKISDMNNLDPGRPLTENDWLVKKGYKNAGDPSYEPARKLIKTIKAALPGYARLNARIRGKVENQGHVTTLFGRKQPVNRTKAYVGLNALIQGSAADVMKQGLVNAYEALTTIGGLPLLVVHDELVVEVPIDKAQEALEACKQAMVEAGASLSPSLAVSGTIVTTSYADA